MYPQKKRLLILGKEKWFLSLGKISPNLREIFTHFYSTQGNISLFLGKSFAGKLFQML
jgi:hypothetical protein